ncbi:amidase domain-containing protein [Agromyces sp. Marseille-Q5079]|uniref:amidase domain-containing protein n=1 Tax=Agromyces sp. Marseille-Q5079 TaxID=3439059 RepID=UPI003D9C9209
MTNPPRTRAFRRRRALVLVAAATAVTLVCGFVALGWAAAIPDTTATTSESKDSTTVDADADAADAVDTAAVIDWASLSPAVTAQMQYVQEHWDSIESEEFGFIEENDCMDFASQSLLARGWLEDDDWWYAVGDAYSSSAAWRSSTAFMEYLLEHPEKATMLTDAQRDQVKVGDIVQFDWDVSGDRDHTGIVTAIVTKDDGSIDIEYAGHTDATWDRSVDWSITEQHPGGVATYWSIAD